MARTRVNNRAVTHLWASQAQGYASGPSVSFNGREIRSYSEPMGCIFDVEELIDVEGETVKRGSKVVLLNNQNYSVTTSKHQGWIRYAVNHLTCFNVPYVNASHFRSSGYRQNVTTNFHDANIAAYLESFDGMLERIRKPKASFWFGNFDDWRDVLDARVEYVENYLDEARLYAKTFNLSFPHVDLLSAKQSIVDAFEAYYSSESIAKREASAAKRDAKRELVENAIDAFLDHGTAIPDGFRSVMTVDQKKTVDRRKNYLAMCKSFAEWMLGERTNPPASYEFREHNEEYSILAEHEEAQRVVFARERVARETANREAWQRGENVRFHGTDENGCAFVRVAGELLETSQGASVPLAHAKLIHALATRCRAKGEAYTVPPNAPKRVGHYQLSKIAADGSITVGCHTIGYEEMKRAANQIGFNPETVEETV
jgi:hypothetical protein